MIHDGVVLDPLTFIRYSYCCLRFFLLSVAADRAAASVLSVFVGWPFRPTFASHQRSPLNVPSRSKRPSPSFV